MDELTLEENLTCTICFNIFTDPVVLKCRHSFCQECLQKYWKDLDVLLCPICRKECSSEEPTLSLAFKSICESVKQRTGVARPALQPEQLCSLHGEKLKLFCANDQQPICVSCLTSEKHKTHTCTPIKEAMEDLKKEMDADLCTRLKMLEKTEKELETMATHVKNQARYAGTHIRKEFEELHKFLQKQEAARLQALGEERDRKHGVIQVRLSSVHEEIITLKRTMNKEKMESDDFLFLQTYSSNPHRNQRVTAQEGTLSGVLINMARHVCSHSHQLWRQAYIPHSVMVLDPNTASQNLVISEDLTSLVCAKHKQTVPDNPERFRAGVLGSKGFTSGRHCWEVKVGDNSNWVVGVVKESIIRKWRKIRPEDGLWSLCYKDGIHVGNSKGGFVQLNGRPRVIRIQLDYDLGQLMFSDPIKKVHLYSFTEVFKDKLFPYFYTESSKCPLLLSIP